MNAPLRTPVVSEEARPAGMLEYETRSAIRDLIRLYGFEAARDLIAGYLTDEHARSARK